ncbi:MAG: hypothetical protein DRP94_09255 [Candidatus Latescibacterota bacterium]|nr:MAG: hypothetical protein DRP94_09255 [Candidatus Latescibacterota bacterium]
MRALTVAVLVLALLLPSSPGVGAKGLDFPLKKPKVEKRSALDLAKTTLVLLSTAGITLGAAYLGHWWKEKLPPPPGPPGRAQSIPRGRR